MSGSLGSTPSNDCPGQLQLVLSHKVQHEKELARSVFLRWFTAFRGIGEKRLAAGTLALSTPIGLSVGEILLGRYCRTEERSEQA